MDHNGTSLYLKGWIKPETLHPPILVVHDVGESIANYDTFAQKLLNDNFSIFAFDLRGHGRSGRMMGHIPRFETLVNDLLQIVAWIRYQSNGKLPTIIGQGVGCHIVLKFRQSFKKLCPQIVLVSPSIPFQGQIPFIQYSIIWILAEWSPTLRLPRWLIPRFLLPTKRLPMLVAHDKTHIGIQLLTVNFCREIIANLNGIFDCIKNLDCPALFLFPDPTPEYDDSEIQKMIENHQSQHLIDWKKIPVSGHYLLTDNGVGQKWAVNSIASWLNTLNSPSNKK